ncbi:MAG: 3-phosphoshikimate 1-carboxyvinyltransferase, partial [Elusimicrobiota bacterium]
MRTIRPARKIEGEITVSPDKSITHRAIIFSALSRGKSQVKNYLRAQDCLDTLKAFKKLGVDIKKEDKSTIIINGKGRNGLKKPAGKLYFGNSATGMRLMAGVLSGQKFPTTLSGDESLLKRPMRRITIPLSKMGADIKAYKGEFPPIKIKPSTLSPIHYNSPIASAQVKSCILLAGLYASGSTSVTEPHRSRDHTERMMKYFEIPLKKQKNKISVSGEVNWPGRSITVPGDFSSAAFFITAGLLLPGSGLKIKKVNLNSTRTGFMHAAKKMGGDIEISNKKYRFGEPLGDLIIKKSSLKGIYITAKKIPALIDEVPLLALLAANASGKSVIEGAGELRK